MTLDGFQRKYLRKLAHPMRPLVQVGEAGVSEAVLGAIRAALEDHELVKVRMRQPEDKKATATLMAERCGADLCGLIGHTAILYRAHPEKPNIELPERG